MSLKRHCLCLDELTEIAVDNAAQVQTKLRSHCLRLLFYLRIGFYVNNCCIHILPVGRQVYTVYTLSMLCQYFSCAPQAIKQFLQQKDFRFQCVKRRVRFHPALPRTYIHLIQEKSCLKKLLFVYFHQQKGVFLIEKAARLQPKEI